LSQTAVLEGVFFFPGEVDGSASCTQVISADGLNRLSVIHVSHSSESIRSANKPGDVFIPSHSADSVAHGEVLLTWHSLTHVPRERPSLVFMKPTGSPSSERPLCFTAANQLLKYFPHMWRSVHVYIWTVGKKRGRQRERERCV